ncbi:MAG: TIGR00266 family protein [Candidatus Electrothrix aestuarii]|uniref:TIGR00266 family protein n=1 Tax=Candidatus Electrothrix aestuarii TaxID=3062594 RepID=A0AAU8M2U1_9BACT|nr:TIGR00266 family protein [Candidatus Electrothrix aestuarii]
MDIKIHYRPGCSAALVTLQPGEVLTAEGGAMITMSGDVDITTTTHKKESGGIVKALKRMVSGESFFLNHFTAGEKKGKVFLGTALPGDMMAYELDNERLIVQSGSYVASSEGVEIDLGWQGFKSMFSGEGMFWLNISGKGKVLINSFGAIYPVKVKGEYIVDTGHIVAFNETLDFTLTKAGKSWASSFLGGEGLVCKFKGNGTVWCQSHNPSSFGHALGPSLKPR